MNGAGMLVSQKGITVTHSAHSVFRKQFWLYLLFLLSTGDSKIGDQSPKILMRLSIGQINRQSLELSHFS